MNGPVTIGVRPEDISPHGVQLHADALRIRGRVEVVEPMGLETYVYLRLGTEALVSRADAHDRFIVGSEVDLGLNVAKVHFFDTQTGVALR